MVTIGAAAASTVSVAGDVVTLPAKLVKTASYSYPLIAVVALLIVSEPVVLPL